MSENSSNRDLLKSIRGILFFGVPNQGMDIQSFIPMVGDQPNRYLLETLDKASERLRLQSKQFREAFVSRGSEIVSFYETSTSPTAENVSNQSWILLLGISNISHRRTEYGACLVAPLFSSTVHPQYTRGTGTALDKMFMRLIEHILIW